MNGVYQTAGGGKADETANVKLEYESVGLGGPVKFTCKVENISLSMRERILPISDFLESAIRSSRASRAACLSAHTSSACLCTCSD